MRQGNVFSMWVHGKDAQPHLFIPWELLQAWEEFDTVVWTDNRDGTYTLTPKKLER